MTVCMNSYCSRSRHCRSELRNAGQQSTSGGASGAIAVDNAAEECEAVQRRPGHIAGLRQHGHNSGGGSYQQRDLTSSREFDERAIVGSDQRRGLHACNEVQSHRCRQRSTDSLSVARSFSCPRNDQPPQSSRQSAAGRRIESLYPSQSQPHWELLPSIAGYIQQQREHDDASGARLPLSDKLSLHGERLSLLRLQCKS